MPDEARAAEGPVPGPWSRIEKRNLESLEHELQFVIGLIEERAARGLPAHREKVRARALRWALDELAASRGVVP